MKINPLALFIGFVIGNFVWQVFGEQLWEKAIEISFFQGFIVGVVYVFFQKNT